MNDIAVDQTLYNSQICRLCGEANTNGTNLYGNEDDEIDISLLINRYLPIKVCVFIKIVMTLTFSCCVEPIFSLRLHFFFLKISDDGNYPRFICPGCHINVESTVQFFDLIITGQIQLKEFLKNQDERFNLSNENEEIFLNPAAWTYESKF